MLLCELSCSKSTFIHCLGEMSPASMVQEKSHSNFKGVKKNDDYNEPSSYQDQWGKISLACASKFPVPSLNLLLSFQYLRPRLGTLMFILKQSRHIHTNSIFSFLKYFIYSHTFSTLFNILAYEVQFQVWH